MSLKKPPPLNIPSSSNSTCCGVIEEAAYKSRAKRAARTKAQPWIVLKLMVFVTIGIIGYSGYVFIGRLCVNLIKRKGGEKRGTGIGLLVVFSILFLWMAWAYIKVILTPPGFARDYVKKTARPMYPEPPPRHVQQFTPYDHDHEHDGGGGNDEDGERHSIGGPSYENIPPSFGPTASHQPIGSDTIGALSNQTNVYGIGREQGDDHETSEKITGGASSGAGMGTETLRSENQIQTQINTHTQMQTQYPPGRIQRKPLLTPILRPEHRYCSIDEIVKPYRTHHCRSCGTCILKYDHHCPWIGQCVGARNHKFFLNFVQSASVYTTYVLVALIVFVVHDANVEASVEVQVENRAGDVDPQKVVIIALSAVFALFTILLQVTHVQLIFSGYTTLESLQARQMKDRETRVLNDEVGGWLGCGGILEKRRIRREWDAEWGRLDKEGNIWWLGNARKEWEEVMGTNALGWILPIGRSLNDGLTYPVNPRFDEQGIWRRRTEWPAELR